MKMIIDIKDAVRLISQMKKYTVCELAQVLMIAELAQTPDPHPHRNWKKYINEATSNKH